MPRISKKEKDSVKEKVDIKSTINKLDVSKLNTVLTTSGKILRILYILLIILFVYVGVLVIKEFNILPFILKILSVISPLFIGFIIAWLLNPLVSKLTEKGMKRGLSVIVVFAGLILFLYLFALAILPALTDQIKDIVASIPSIINDMKTWAESIFDRVSDMSLENMNSYKKEFFDSIELFASGIQTKLPQMTINFISNFASGLGTILLSFIVGFYMLFNFDNVSEHFVKILPVKYREETYELLKKVSNIAHDYVKGTLVLSLILMIVSLIGFSIIGLKGPLLIALICAITNLIPYIGPYLGAAVAALVGFSQSSVVGILTLIFILITQTLEGNFLHPLIMSKKMDLHPVTILISLLLFGYFFGIIGMIVATPLAALIKIVFVHYNNKYKIFSIK